jgi:hypothetical protein
MKGRGERTFAEKSMGLQEYDNWFVPLFGLLSLFKYCRQMTNVLMLYISLIITVSLRHIISLVSIHVIRVTSFEISIVIFFHCYSLYHCVMENLCQIENLWNKFMMITLSSSWTEALFKL